MINIVSYVDGEAYIDDEVPGFLLNKNFFVRNKEGNLVLKMSGLINRFNTYYLFLPKGFDNSLSTKDKLHTTKLIFHTLLKYKNSKPLNEHENEWLGHKSDSANYLDNMCWIINDYIKNGFFIEKEQIREVNGRGKIDWARTIKSQKPIYTGKSFFYHNLLNIKNEVNTNNIISNIHKRVVEECIEKVGWLLNIKSNHHNTFTGLDVEDEIRLLQKKLSSTFVGHDIKLLTSLISYLKQTSIQNNSYELVTPYFQYVWEEMLKVTCNNDVRLQKDMPKPYWVINDSKIYTLQKPDILVFKDNTLLIIDAKYYSTASQNVSRYPGWDSIVKQLFYAKSLEDNYKNIKNVFLMPDTIRDKTGIRKIGATSVEENEAKFGYVFSYGIDTELVLRNYLQNTHWINLVDVILNNSDSAIYFKEVND